MDQGMTHAELWARSEMMPGDRAFSTADGGAFILHPCRYSATGYRVSYYSESGLERAGAAVAVAKLNGDYP